MATGIWKFQAIADNTDLNAFDSQMYYITKRLNNYSAEVRFAIKQS